MAKLIHFFKWHLLVFLMVLGVLSSCNKNQELEILSEADNIIESDPSQVLEILDNIDKSGLTPADSARYALLYTQAQIKTGISVTSDSIIRKACTYYTENKPASYIIRSRFYLAKVLFNAANNIEAMKHVLKAYELAKAQQSHYWIAKSTELISDIFRASTNYEQAEKYTAQTIENYDLAHCPSNKRYALCDMAIIYLNTERYEQARTLLDSLYTACSRENPIDSTFLKYLYIPLNTSMLGEEVPKKDYPLFAPYMNAGDNVDRAILSSYLASEDSNFNGAKETLSIGNPTTTDDKDRFRLLYAEFKNYIAQANYKEAAIIADSAMCLQNKIAEYYLNESVTSVQRDFYSNEAEINRLENSSLKEQLLLIIVVVLLLLVLGWWIYRLRISNKEAQIEKAMTILTNMRNKAEATTAQNQLLERMFKEEREIATHYKEKYENKERELDDTSKKLSHKIKELSSTSHELDRVSKEMALRVEASKAEFIEYLFKEKWSMLNTLCNEYELLEDSDLNRKIMLNKFEKEIAKLRTPKKQKEIEEAVNKCMGGIMTLIREECSFIKKEQDIVFLSLLLAGFSARAISIILDIKYKMVYLKKSRLVNRISSSEAPHKHLIIERIGIRRDNKQLPY